MLNLEHLKEGAAIRGILPNHIVTVVAVKWHGKDVVTLTYRDASGKVDERLVYRHDEPTLELVTQGRPWSFDADGAMLRLVSEAKRISLAHLFDPYLAIHTSLVRPLPHQITAVYESMLPRQPLRFLLADDPGAGKTIMAGLFIKELLLRGDLQRCLIVCPGILVEQWQDELYEKFGLDFEILSRETFETSLTGNPFLEKNLVISRLDHLSRNEELQAKLDQTDWDLIICDEAHKMSASYFGTEVKYTKRYRLGQRLGGLTRNFLLMTATPHNGKEADFQLFMALLDGDRFEGKFRDGVHTSDPSDLMRRLTKEQLLQFDGRPLFPERIANTVAYTLSDGEAALYADVTEYVTTQFNRADELEGGRRGTIGFALTTLQRRLASSPEAIYQSLRRRRERLEERLAAEKLMKRGADVRLAADEVLSEDELEDIEDAPEIETVEEEIVDRATAAQTIAELEAEIEILRDLEAKALRVRNSGTDKKWDELSKLLQENDEIIDEHGQHRKLVIFTEHRDTLHYLSRKLRNILGREEAVVVVHGGMAREDRRTAQERFTQDRDTVIFLATDAAGEGINLQRAHLMVNYDLPWNPNRIEQRFGRIHRIGQTEVCFLWNLVAAETREGDVYRKLLDKLEEESHALQGQVFDVLGKLVFFDGKDGSPKTLRDLLIDAIRYGNDPKVRAKLEQAVDNALDRDRILALVEENALAHDTMDASRVQQIREEMERAEARRLQPFYIASFFRQAFEQLGGKIVERETDRYEIRNVPAVIRNRDRQIGTREPVLDKYERVTFKKDLQAVPGKPLAKFISPGHPLLDAVIDLTLERHRDLLKQGAILVDENDPGEEPRMLFYLEHAIQDARTTKSGDKRIVSRRLLFVEVDRHGNDRTAGYAPYLDYRPLTDEECDAVRTQDLGPRGGPDGTSLSGPHRVAEGDGFGEGDLLSGAGASTGGNVRNAFAADARSHLRPSEHRGGLVEGDGEGQSQLSGNRSGLARRDRDVVDALRGDRLVQAREDDHDARADHGGGENAQHSSPQTPRTPLGPRSYVLTALTDLLSRDLDESALSFAIANIVPAHFAELKTRKEAHVAKAIAAVKDRLTKEITYWDHRANELKNQELAGKTNAKLNSGKARQRAEELERRLHKRMQDLEEERQLSPLPPVVVGGALILPQGLINRLFVRMPHPQPATFAHETEEVERLAMQAVMQHERSLGFEPRDVSSQNVGYDIESRHAVTGRLRFIEVKGRVKGADTVTVTRNEMLTALNSPDEWRLAIVIVDGDAQPPIYVAHPFTREPQFGETSANFSLDKLISTTTIRM